MFTVEYRGPMQSAFDEPTYSEIAKFSPTEDGALVARVQRKETAATLRNRLGTTQPSGPQVRVFADDGHEMSPQELLV